MTIFTNKCLKQNIKKIKEKRNSYTNGEKVLVTSCEVTVTTAIKNCIQLELLFTPALSPIVFASGKT